MNTYDLNGKLAVVTGAAQGIGYAVAERFVASGANVVIWDMDEAAACDAANEVGAVGKQGLDVTNTDAVARAAEDVRSRHGTIDILVNSAGISGPNAKVVDYPPEDWRQIIDVNLNGTFNTCRAVVPQMVETGYGRVVNIASVAGKEGNPNAAAYSASKAAVIALTKALGKEHADQDIAVNCVTPAAAKTRIFDQMTDEHIAYMLSKIPRERFVNVEEIASLISWLCSAENSFATGAAYDISGGRATY